MHFKCGGGFECKDAPCVACTECQPMSHEEEDK
jgi:hypothetical protein